MTYKRVVITEFGKADLMQVQEEKALPEPGPGEARIRVLRASTNFTDVMIRKGKYPEVKGK